MKIIVLNNSGNVGKSFITRELLFNKCNQENGRIVEVETHNSSSSKFKSLKDFIVKIEGNQINELFKMILSEDDLIVDVGASNVIEFLKTLTKTNADMILDEIDMFIVPSTPDIKIQEDTIKTIVALKSFGVENKIKVIFNKFENKNQFKDLIDKLNKIGIKINEDLVIFNYENLNEIEKMGVTINELANNEKDYKALAKKAYREGNMEEGNKYADLALMKGSAVTIDKQLDEICNKLKGE